MAYIKDYTITEYTTTTSTWTPDEMPVHASGDLLLALFGHDGSITINEASGWTRDIRQLVTGGGVCCQSKRATSGSETFSTTSSGADTGVLVMVSVSDVYGSSLSDAWDLSPVVAGSDATTNPCAGVSGQSTTYNNSLIIRMMGGDGGQSPTAYPPNVNLYNGDAGQGSLGVAYTAQKTAGTITQAYWYVRLNSENQREILMAVRNVASGKVGAFSDSAITSATFHRALGWNVTAGQIPFADTWKTASPNDITSVGGITCNWDAGTAVGDGGTNPYADGLNFTPASSKTLMYGLQLSFASALNMDTGIVYVCFRPTVHRDGAVDPGKVGLTGGGLSILLADASNNYESHIISGRDAFDIDKAGYNICAFDWNGGSTAWASSGTVNKSAVAKIMFCGRGYFGAIASCISMLCQVVKIGIAGGSSVIPLNFDDIDVVLNNSVGILPLFKRSASQGILYVPVQIGGDSPVFMSVNLRTFVFPKRYSISDKYVTWNAGDNVAGIKFYPQTGDMIQFTNCLFISESPYRWEFDASSASSGWTGSFSGTSVIGATVTLQDAMTFDNMKFTDCPTFTQNGATITNSDFTNTKVDCSSPANAEKISNCSFTSGGSGHAIEISGSATDMDLTGVTFSGYSGTGTDAPIYVNIASGTMSITILGGGDTPTIRTAGATVNVISGTVDTEVTVKDLSTGLNIENARVLVSVANGDNYPYQDSISITGSGTTATVTHTGHGMATNDYVIISGVTNDDDYNGVFQITKISDNSYSYTADDTLEASASGTPIATFAVIHGLTSASGYIKDTRTWSANQSITGWVRKSTSSPYYQQGSISGTINKDSGFSITVQLVSDE